MSPCWIAANRSCVCRRGAGGVSQERDVLQVRAVELVHLHQVAQPERAIDLPDVLGRQLEMAHEQAAHGVAHGWLDHERHHVVEPPPVDALLHRLEQVARFQLLDRDLGVPDHAEWVRLDDPRAGKQPAEVGGEELLEPGQRDRRAARTRIRGRHGDQPRQHVGHFHAGEVPAAIGTVEQHRQVEAEIGDARERVAGVHAQGRADGKHHVLEVGRERLLLGGRKRLVIGEDDAVLGEPRQQLLGEHPRVLGYLGVKGVADGGQLLRRRAAVAERLGHPAAHLVPQPGHPDHEELVQVGAEDGHVLQALEERLAWIQRLAEHAVVEGDPA